MNNLLTDYFPTPATIDPTAIMNARQRLVAILQAWWPELDTRPGSVFGDLHMTPLAVLMASSETAMQRFKSDLDLANVAQGIIYDSDFVTAFLANFGVSSQSAIAASGTISIVFSVNQSYVLNADATFTFGTSVFKINNGGISPVVINPTGVTTGLWTLTQTGTNQFTVLLPVTGPAGSSVPDGSIPTYTLTQTQIISVTASGDFDSGEIAESLPQMAIRAQSTFASATLTSRSGAISFLTQTWPAMQGASPVITGDPEMIRASQNPLGLSEGAMDVFIRSRPVLAAASAILTLTYNTTLGGWIGLLQFPSVPAFFDFSQGVFQVGDYGNPQSVDAVYSSSTHPRVDNLGVAFSKYEQLGILITDSSPANVTQASISPAVQLSGNPATLAVSGVYGGYFFSSGSGRSITLKLEAVTTFNNQPAVLGSVVDALTGETAQVYFVGNATTGATAGLLVQSGFGYNQMFSGMNITLTSSSNTFVPANFLGAIFQFSYQGQTANFNANYLYDSTLSQVDTVLQDPDNIPVNVSIFTKSMLPCYISQFFVSYRLGLGQTFDSTTAQQQIYNYLTSLIYPSVYDESVIGQILVANGALSLVSVAKRGLIYPSLGNNYVDKSGNITPVPQLITTTLLPAANTVGVGARNIAYLLSQNTIQFNEIIV